MTSTGTPQTSSSPLPPSRRSLLSRLASPLRSRTRNLADFHIRPSEPYRQYSPGDVVKGLVVLVVVKPIRITHLTVALHGFVRVFKTSNGVSDGAACDPTSTPGSKTRKSQYFGNGHASLFRDEVTLCGEGRLDVGVYEFEFDLEFPSTGLPTSIDFERGSISYMIRATITRPTSIAATSNCDRKISLIETVDIGPMLPPKPQTISLEPIPRRPKKPPKISSSVAKSKADRKASDAGNKSESVRGGNSPHPEESASQRPSSDHGVVPRSPVTSEFQSETSGESVVSSSTGLSYRTGHVPPSKSFSQGSVVKSAVDRNTITTTIELLKAGCLPGDNIPMRVSIQHTKFIRSMHGIIITLYRQGRIDSAPPLSMFSDMKGKSAERLKHEEYYPKSKTGLGGLSLSSAGSSSVFRKDLSQVFRPIILDPSTLSTVVKCSIRVPEDVFPTITGVPGQMISFRYHIEVVIDLGGKLAATHEKTLPPLSMMNVSPNFMNAGGHVSGLENGTTADMLSTWGGSIVDTDHIRREKSVVACLFEVIVGTTDSARLRGRGNIPTAIHPTGQTITTPYPPAVTNIPTNEPNTTQTSTIEESSRDGHFPYHGDVQYPAQTLGPEGEASHSSGYEPIENSTNQSRQYTPAFVPPPEIPPEEELSEKDRIRQAEERLLPSRPPQDESTSSSHAMEPTAPEVPLEDLYSARDERAPTNYPIGILSPSERPYSSHITPHEPPAPPPSDTADVTPQTMTSTTEDKQELERLRLMAEASAPPEVPDDDENVGEGSSSAHHEPTAPILPEEDDYAGQHASVGQYQEGLPRYER